MFKGCIALFFLALAAMAPPSLAVNRKGKRVSEPTLRPSNRPVGGQYMQSIAAGKDLLLEGKHDFLLLNRKIELRHASATLELGRYIKLETNDGSRTFEVLPGYGEKDVLQIVETTGSKPVPKNVAGVWATRYQNHRRLQLVSDAQENFLVIHRADSSEQAYLAKRIMGNGEITRNNYFLTDNNHFFVVTGGDVPDRGLTIDWLQPDIAHNFAKGPVQEDIPVHLDDPSIVTNAAGRARPTLIVPATGELIHVDWRNKTWRRYFSTFKVPPKMEKRDLAIPPVVLPGD